MNRIPGYLVVALLGLVFISAGLITMFADQEEAVPAEEGVVILPTATFTETPTLTPMPTTVMPPTAVMVPTQVIPTATVEIPPTPTMVVPTATIELSATATFVPPTEIVPAQPTVDTQASSELTAEVPVDVGAQGVPTEVAPADGALQPEQTVEVTAEMTPDPTLPVDTMQLSPPPVGEAQASGGVSAAAVGDSATVALNATSVPADAAQPTPAQPLSGDGSAQQPTAQVVMPTSDPGIVPTVEVPPVTPLDPTVDPALLPTVDAGPSAEATVAVVVDAIPSNVLGNVTLPDRQDHSGIKVTLTLSDGTSIESVTDVAGTFIFPDLQPGVYRVEAGAEGYLSRQMEFTLSEGQDFVLPPTSLLMGDTNLDNMIDLSDAALIASNFDGPATVASADVNRDGWVDVKDLTLIGADFGRSGPLPWS